MPTITTSNITASIEPMWGDRTRRVTWGSSTARLPYVVEVLDPGNAADIDTLERYVIEAALEYFRENPVDEMFFVEMEVDSTINDHTWKLFASYDGRGMWYADENTFEYDFDTVGGQQHITASRWTTAYPAGAIKPGGINAVNDEVKGTDIVIPGFNFSVTRSLDAAYVNSAYQQILRALTGTVNNAEWHGYAAGEVLFIGASGTRRGEESVKLTYKFSALPNQTTENGNPATVSEFVYDAAGPVAPEGFENGDLIPIDKLGWQYLWVAFADHVKNEGGKKMATKKPIAVYVEDVYPYTDFTALGLGG